MGDVVANMSMSLDGYIEDARGGVDEVFAWLYGSGNAEVATPADDRKFTTSEASAVAQAKAVAGDRTVAVASADLAQQCLNLGLLDAIVVDLVPVLLAGGKPFFANLQQLVALSTPTVVEGNGITHLTYRVRNRA
ncbi:MAG TPA: hypothetical protein VF241_15605 [Propionibacteriaceae bacterium]